MDERAVQFGSERHLAGVLHLPTGSPGGQRPGILIFTAGLDHRVGPKRLYVALARGLAAAGYPVLRFDGPGVGDSSNPSHVLTPDSTWDAVPAEAAATVLRQLAGVQSLVVLGLCGGAGDAHEHALADESVIAEVLIDGYIYPTLRFKLRYVWQRISSLKRWRDLWRRKFGDGEQLHVAVDAALEEEAFFDMPPQADMAEQLQQLLDRGLQLFYVYSGDSNPWYNYEGQFRASFQSLNLGGAFDERLMPQADHTFSRSVDRAALVRAISGWLDARFTPGTTPQQPPSAPRA